MESHKKILAILYIISGVLTMVILAACALLVTTFIPLFASKVDPDKMWVFEMIGSIIPSILWIIIILFAIPSIIGGAALLQGKSWALTLLLILGCFKLFNFPIGTALGVYTIWVYAESNKPAAA